MKENLDYLAVGGKIENKGQENGQELKQSDYFLSMRESIQAMLEGFEDKEYEENRLKLLKELVSPELSKGYKEILGLFREKSAIYEDHPEREYIDIEEESIEAKIEEWISDLKKELKDKTNASEEELAELEAESWMFFDSLATSLNTKSIEREVKEYVEENKVDVEDEKAYKKEKQKLSENLEQRFPMDKKELNHLVDLIAKEDFSEYNIQKVIQTLSHIYEEYKLGDAKTEIGKVVAGYLASEGISAIAPYFLQNAGSPDVGENSKAFYGFFGAEFFSRGMRTKVDLMMNELLKNIDLEVNRKITESLFYQKFEFIHEKSMGELYTVLERGKNSINDMTRETISSVIPIIFGSVASVGMLTKINPVLGGIGLASMPVMHYLAKKQNKEITKMYQKEMEDQEKANTAISSVKTAFEEVRTSANMEEIEKETRGHLNKGDESRYERYKKEIKMNFKRMFPFDISTLVAITSGLLLQEKGLIAPGAILSNIIYSSRLNAPIQRLVGIYYNKFPRHIQNIDRMNEILVKYEEMDSPVGGKEEGRKPVTDLENFDISIEGLNYKNILKDIHLHIKEGEFVVLTGPSGAGKSTLLRNMIGLFDPTGGEVKIGAIKIEDIKKFGPDSIYSAVSYSNQNPQIFPEMSLRDNLLLWSKDVKSDEVIKEVLYSLQLDEFVHKLDENLKYASGGEKVRIGLARTLLKDPKILLLDEPTASLDSSSKQEVLEVIRNIRKKHPEKTIVCISHDDDLIGEGDRKVDISKTTPKQK